MGDPECQSILTRLETDLLEIICASIDNNILDLNIEWKKEKSICIALCAKVYADKPKKNIEIKKINNIELEKNEFIFHAGTYQKDAKIYSNVLNAQ